MNVEKLKLIGIKLIPLALFMVWLSFHTIIAFYMKINVISMEQDRIIFVPAMWLLPNPLHRYTAMLITGGALASIVPVTVYKITECIGIVSIWQRVLVSTVAGAYPALIFYTKLAGGDSLGFLFPCLLAFIMLKTSDTKSYASKYFLTVLLAITVVSIPFFLWGDVELVIAIVMTLIIARVFFKREIVPLFSFMVLLIVFAVLLDSVTINSVYINHITKPGTWSSQFWFIAEKLHELSVSTWGLGILGLCLFIKNIRAKNHISLKLFSIFVVISTVLIHRLDFIIPLVLVATVCLIFIHGIELRDVLACVTVLGIIFSAFFMLQPDSIFVGALGHGGKLMPIPPEVINAQIMTASIVFCLMALFIVFVCCGGRYKVKITSSAIAVISLYGAVHVCAVEIPAEIRETTQRDAHVYEVSELLYNSEGAPPVFVVDESWSMSELLQFLNPRATVEYFDLEALPENYLYVIKSTNRKFHAYNREFILIGTTDLYSVYAVGERAIMYVQSHETHEEDEEEKV
jgi:hypothetical protein